MTLIVNNKTYEAGELIAYVKKLEKRCVNYEMKISKMEKGTCDICKETEKDKRLAELEKENAELKEKLKHRNCLDCSNHSSNLRMRTLELEKENAELKNNNKVYCEGNGETLVVNVSFDSFTRINANHKLYYPHNKELEKENAVLERRIERAKGCMKKLLFIINSDPANYNCKGLIQDAEDFIYNRTCNIRQQGKHCISEIRCIMCDKGDKNDRSKNLSDL